MRIRWMALALLTCAVTARTARSQTIDPNLWVPNGPVYTMATSGTTLYLGGSFSKVSPATGAAVGLDPTTGAPLAAYSRISGTVRAVASDGAGGWFLGGSFALVQGQSRANVAHVDASGNVTSWNPGADQPVDCILVNGGTVYLGGEFLNVADSTRGHLAAVDAATGAVSSWNPNADARVYALAISGSTIYAGGAFMDVGGVTRDRIAAIDTTTGLATGWNPDADDEVRALDLAGDRLFVGGYFRNIGGQARDRAAALDLVTGLANAWNPGANLDVRALLRGGATMFVGGSFTTIGGVPRSHIAAVDTVTGAATGWNPSASGPAGTGVFALARSGNLIYAAGTFTSIGGQSRNHLAALDATTAAATSWDPNASATALAIATSGGAIFAGGSFLSVGGQARTNLAALDLATGAPTGFLANANGTVYALLVHSGVVYAGGSFSTIGGQSRTNVAALDPSTGLATSWNPNAAGFVFALAANVAGGPVYAGGSFTSIGGQPRTYLAALDPSTGLATSWSPNADNVVSALALMGGHVYAGGSFALIGGQSRAKIAALDAGTALATSWNPSSNGTVNALAFSADTVTLYVGGDFSNIGGQPRSRVAAIDAATGLATSWNPNATPIAGTVYALAVKDHGLYVGGNFTRMGGQNRNRVAVVNTLNGAAAPWDPNAGAAVEALAIHGSTIYVGGDFTSILASPQSYAAAFSEEQSTPVLLSLASATAEAGRVTLVWLDPTRATNAARLERRTVESGWRVLALVSADGAGRFRYQDRDVVAGTRYGYRLAFKGGAGEHLTDEAWVEVPRTTELALRGVRPNPSRGPMMVAFSLPDDSPATIEVIDVAGRRVLSQSVSGRGDHLVNLRSARLAPGAYRVQLSHAGQRLVTGAVMVR